MKKNRLRTAACLLLAGTVLAAFVAMAAEVGSQGDPLVSLSYLNDTFLGQILDKVDEKLAQRNTQLRQELEAELQAMEQGANSLPGSAASTGSGSYAAVTLYAGQSLCGSAGCEILLRSGSASCTSDSGGTTALVDTTSGSSLHSGAALTKDHLYMAPDSAHVAASDTVVLLVRGDYTVE